MLFFFPFPSSFWKLNASNESWRFPFSLEEFPFKFLYQGDLSWKYNVNEIIFSSWRSPISSPARLSLFPFCNESITPKATEKEMNFNQIFLSGLLSET